MHKSMFVAAASFAAALVLATPAHAVNYPVTGTVTVNGTAGTLPAGGTFGDSTYDTATGELSTGKFTFPESSTVVMFGSVPVTVFYQLTQSNTSTALVASDGTAAMTSVATQLSITRTVPPFQVTPCGFGPITLDLAGTGSSAGLDLEDRSFTVPPTTDSCGTYASQINGQLATSNNSITPHLAGDFTPPPSDKIFFDGFDD